MIGFLLGNWQRFALYGALAAAVSALLVGYGYHLGVKQLWDYQAKQATEAVRVAKVQGAVTERVVTKYVKVAGATQTVTNTVKEEVLRYVERNPGSCLDAQWGRLHDAAALDRVPDPESVAHAAAGAPTAAAAVETVTQNYAACHRNADRLKALQEWVTEQEAAR